MPAASLAHCAFIAPAIEPSMARNARGSIRICSYLHIKAAGQPWSRPSDQDIIAWVLLSALAAEVRALLRWPVTSSGRPSEEALAAAR